MYTLSFFHLVYLGDDLIMYHIVYRSVSFILIAASDFIIQVCVSQLSTWMDV